MKKSSPFQIIVLCIFGALGVGSMIVFALFVNGNQTARTGPVVIWGTLDGKVFESVLKYLSVENEVYKETTYVQKGATDFPDVLARALASGQGPDLVLLSQDQAYLEAPNMLRFPESEISPSQFTDMYVYSAAPFVTAEGVMAIPVIADPLILYSNKDLLAAAGYSLPPKYWDELFDMARVITGCGVARGGTVGYVTGCDRDSLSIKKATIALGTYDNVDHAKDILSTIILQSGGSITRRDESGALISALITRGNQSTSPTESALRFYTEFSDPSKDDYSWSSAMRDSHSAFSAGDLALYIGYASERYLIANANPNLNVGYSFLPQIRNKNSVITGARVYGLAIPRTSTNPTGAAQVAYNFSDSFASLVTANAYGIVSARRDVLSQGGSKVVPSLFASSTIVSASWIDPDPQKTDALFRAMITDVVSGTVRLTEGASRADQQLKAILDVP